MIYINDKDSHEYYKRPGAYAIIQNDKDEIAIVKDSDHNKFFFGGGVEKGEEILDTLKRELIEESGYTLKNISYFTEVAEFLKGKSGKYLEVLATIYIAQLDKKIKEPIEKDHQLIWINPLEYKGKLFRTWQNYTLDKYIEYKKHL